MTNGQKHEYEIALKIYSYDLSIIDKELEHVSRCCEEYKGEPFSEYCKKRMTDLFPLRDKKVKQIIDLNEKYKA
jgi:hypothetical protein